jgi:DNA-directed RNA polymerase beta' subunit
MRPCYNVLSPSNGEVILKPTQDIVIGCYYLTLMINKIPSLIQNWFSTENDALLAFHQKKINIHTSILVRYSLNNFKIKIENRKIKFLDTITALNTNMKEIFILKIYQFGELSKKYYLITNIGVFIASKKTKKEYQVTDLFLETTPGRLIFSINFKNAINI